MTLSLLHTSPDPIALTHWATRKHWLSSDGDLGYALHALLAAAFTGLAPTPFRYMGEQGLLAYSETSSEKLVRQAEDSPPEVRKALGLDSLRLKPFPVDFPSGKRLGFEVRIRPVVRTNAGKERDIYQYRQELAGAGNAESTPSRELVYWEWLSARLRNNNAARLINATLHGFSLRQVVRRPQKGNQFDQRAPKGVTGPDAVFQGELEVIESDAFRDLVRRGIGRHRAFGYGMLLLRPTRT